MNLSFLGFSIIERFLATLGMTEYLFFNKLLGIPRTEKRPKGTAILFATVGERAANSGENPPPFSWWGSLNFQRLL
jgi:hypothetical protein